MNNKQEELDQLLNETFQRKADANPRRAKGMTDEEIKLTEALQARGHENAETKAHIACMLG